MVKESEACGGLEWRINCPNGTSNVLDGEGGYGNRILRGLHGIFTGVLSKICGVFQKAWKLGKNEPNKLIHCFKVGMALSFVSLFYYMRPLYDGVGGTAMWAVLTVVVAFEYTVGATLCKCFNRASGTFLAGVSGIGVHWIASHFGQRFEPIYLQCSVFLLAAAATFSRFIPSIKARFDYGAMIFILTFSLVSVSGYRVEKLFELAHHRLSTIVIGTSICIITSMLLCPVWAGNELHNLIRNNIEKLADSLDGCVVEYFKDDADGNNAKNEASNNILLGYKCVLNSTATEISLANFARWEPAHRGFSFRHPWKKYLKVGASLRSCAYCIEALNSSINLSSKVPEILKKQFSKFCINLSSNSCAVLKESAMVIDTMTKSDKIDLIVEEMNNAVQELESFLKELSEQQIAPTAPKTGETNEVMTELSNTSEMSIPLMEIVPLVTVSSLLIEIATRTQKTAKAVNELADKAEFKVKSRKKSRNSISPEAINQTNGENLC